MYRVLPTALTSPGDLNISRSCRKRAIASLAVTAVTSLSRRSHSCHGGHIPRCHGGQVLSDIKNDKLQKEREDMPGFLTNFFIRQALPPAYPSRPLLSPSLHVPAAPHSPMHPGAATRMHRCRHGRVLQARATVCVCARLRARARARARVRACACGRVTE